MCKKCKAVLDFSHAFALMYSFSVPSYDTAVYCDIIEKIDVAEAHLDDNCIKVCEEPLGFILDTFEKKGEYQS